MPEKVSKKVSLLPPKHAREGELHAYLKGGNNCTSLPDVDDRLNNGLPAHGAVIAAGGDGARRVSGASRELDCACYEVLMPDEHLR